MKYSSLWPSLGRRFFSAVAAVAFFTINSPAQAAKVAKVDGTKIMIELEGGPAKANDLVFALDDAGKKKGIIKIKAVKGDRAIGVLTKGKAEVGWSISAAKKSSGGKASASASSGGTGKTFWGGIFGFGMDAMDVNVDNTADGVGDKIVSLKGNGFSAKGLFDYNLFADFWFRGMGGLEGFNATGSSEVGCGNAACKVGIYYLAADFWARYVVPMNNLHLWGGVGFSVMFPATKSVTALESSSVTNTSVMSFGGGVDFFTSPTFFIPVQFEYGMLPKSGTVKASSMTLRAGFGMPF